MQNNIILAKPEKGPISLFQAIRVLKCSYAITIDWNHTFMTEYIKITEKIRLWKFGIMTKGGCKISPIHISWHHTTTLLHKFLWKWFPPQKQQTIIVCHWNENVTLVQIRQQNTR
jgi:hypothetical protein